MVGIRENLNTVMREQPRQSRPARSINPSPARRLQAQPPIRPSSLCTLCRAGLTSRQIRSGSLASFRRNRPMPVRSVVLSSFGKNTFFPQIAAKACSRVRLVKATLARVPWLRFAKLTARVRSVKTFCDRPLSGVRAPLACASSANLFPQTDTN